SAAVVGESEQPLASALTVRARRTSKPDSPACKSKARPCKENPLFRYRKLESRNSQNQTTTSKDEQNNMFPFARCHNIARGALDRNGTSFQSHGRAFDCSRSGSQHYGRLRVRAD